MSLADDTTLRHEVVLLHFVETGIFGNIQVLAHDTELRHLVKECAMASQQAGEAMLTRFQRHPDALQAVSEGALDAILDSGKGISDIRTNTDISNCLVFHTSNLKGTVVDEHVVSLRRRVDQMVKTRLESLFGVAESAIEVSGHFWYPPGGFMGWHTNLRKPGWRLYITYAEEAGKSFFRYRDPLTREVFTCSDDNWNCRVFLIRPDAPLWHSVYSDTNRHSFGYRIEEQADE